MGKYSLDSFEQYPLTKLRPVVTQPQQDCYRLLELSQAEWEPKNGDRPALPEIGEGAVILRLALDTQRDVADACGFVRRVGAFYEGGKKLAGVVLTVGGFTGVAAAEIANAYQRGFEATALLVEPASELVELCRRAEIVFGLWLDLSNGVLNLRRSIARANLERTWRSRPVYVYSGKELDEQELDAACRWHSSGADCVSALGARMTLRRVMFPSGLTTGGILPLRMWWQNLGTAPMYREVSVRMQLECGARRYDISVPGSMVPGMGDTTFNVTAQLPGIPCGTYRLWVSLECDNGALPLAISTKTENGMYYIGDIILDDIERPYLCTMWEEQYADGYYPLEDPAQPE